IRCYAIKELPVKETRKAILFGVLIPKSISRAVDRNRIKRLIRESYRTNKTIVDTILNKPACCAAFLFSYKQKNIPYKKNLKFIEIQDDMVKILKNISQMDVLN
ncbi:MAG: ribonuclease P protein component, partial [Bacteroidota bacterium]|nr:ribonuclease P protein component [Bacteroidota bacterium]